jgi:TldD protein
VQLPLEPNPTIARRAAWLATDTAYREALIQLAAKRDFRKSGGSSAAGVPSYAKAAALVQDKPVLVPALENNRDLQRRAQDVSRVFRAHKHIRDSRVAFTSFLERRWYMNSEGTSAHDTRRVSGVVIAATSQATDDQELADYFSHYGTTARYLPSDKELVAEAEKLAATLDALRKAPVMDNYTGPVLFEGEGAIGVVRFSLAPHLGGTPVPEGLEASQAKQFGGAISDRIGKGRVLAPMLGLIDDPTARKVGKRALIGGYKIDDEGIPAKRVEVIKNGRLLTLLMGRTPSKDIAKSNGHARRGAPGGGFHGSATNLFVTTKKGLSRRQLIKKLIATVKDEGLPYGLIIRQFDDAAITAAHERTRRELLALINTTDTDAPPPVLLAYRVYPNGKEELVRGVHLKPVDIRAWKDVIATGKKLTIKNLLASEQHNLIHLLRGVEQGFVPSSGVESAIVTPDLLFGEIGVVGSSSGRRTAPAIPRP